MTFLAFTQLLLFFTTCKAGVTDIPPISSDDGEVKIESVSHDTLMPANVFDVGTRLTPEQKSAIPRDSSDSEQWSPDSNPIFRALRSFLFEDSGESTEATESSMTDDPTEEIVKILEKGLIEATTMFLTPSDDETLTTSLSVDPEPITILKIEESPNIPSAISMNTLDMRNKRQGTLSTIANATSACTDCYNNLETCVQQCFSKHNCNHVQRQVSMCPPSPGRVCNFFTQWSPVEECKNHDDCKSPLLCCSDGCVNKCTPGQWRQ